MSRLSLLAIALAASCGGGEAAPDAFVDDGPCWPVPSMPGAQVEMGTGVIAFEPMPAVLEITKSSGQADPYLQVHGRVRGIPPGNPNNIFEATNPRTRVEATIDELSLVLSGCFRFGYDASPEPGAFVMRVSSRVGFGTFPIDQADGKQARITIEIVGANGLYGRDDKVVTLKTPP